MLKINLLNLASLLCRLKYVLNQFIETNFRLSHCKYINKQYGLFIN